MQDKRCLDERSIRGELLEGGRVAKELGGYEERGSQLELLSLIIKGFNENAIVAAEAGTGVGKSFAYLLPAIHFLLEEKRREVRERIVISTATINLQQQLFDKDVPLVLSALGGPPAGRVKAVLVKGRRNYLCLRRLHDALAEASLFEDEERMVLERVAGWAETTKTGSKTELPFSQSARIWPRVCSESDACMGKKCPNRGRCFVQSLRREAASADLLVVNHHLLFADLAARQDGDLNEGNFVLPPFSRVIIDEAHNIENAATSFFSAQFSYAGLLQTAGQLFRKRRGKPRGILVRAAAELSGSGQFDMVVQNVRDAAAALSGAAVELCGGEQAFRLTGSKREVVNARLVPAFASLQSALHSLSKTMADLEKQLAQKIEGMEEPGIELASLTWELSAHLHRIHEIDAICGEYVRWEVCDDAVLWVEKRKAQSVQGGFDGWAVFNVTPLEIASRLKNALWDKVEAAILVSATLTVAQTFQYFFRQCGLNGLDGCDTKPLLCGSFPSPFPYKKAVLLAVPDDAPLPNEAAYRAFVDRTIAQLCEVSQGRALALFTSYESMQSAWAYAQPLLRALDIDCYKQGDDDRAHLLETFKNEETSVLFATYSFWEGIDAPGETLSLLIIARLPFRMPGDPVFEARCEALEKDGGNAFMQLSIPEAVMKFRQGFGRLIRNGKDRGVVAVLDGRLLHKQYGRLFLRSLPETKVCFAPVHEVLRAAESFFFP
jgi:ATP-dependent DNA helicase DinG